MKWLVAEVDRLFADAVPVRLQVQMQTVIWSPKARVSETAGVSLLLNDSKELLIRPSRPNEMADGPACSTNQTQRYPRRRDIGFGLDAVFGIGSG